LNDEWHHLDARTLRLNLFLTQGILLAAAIGGGLLFEGWEGMIRLFVLPDPAALGWTGAVVLGIVMVNIAVDRLLPAKWQDDGQINRIVFADLSLLSMFGLCFFVGLSEEWLFRGTIQPMLGLFWTSLLFTVVHVRYLRKPLLIILLFATSLLLGKLAEISGGLIAPVMAHTLIDFLLACYLRYAVDHDERG